MRRDLKRKKVVFLLSSRVTSKEMVQKQKRNGDSRRTRPPDSHFRTSRIKMVYSNVDGLISKLMELKDVVKDKKPQVICLTETKLSTNIIDDILNIGNYNIWRKDRKFRQGGGNDLNK